MITHRQKQLISLLENENSYQTMSYFSEKLGVSERTIYSDINFLQKHGILLEKERGKGVRLKNTESTKNNDIESLLAGSTTIARRVKLIDKLLIKNEIITIESLADEFYVSKSSIRQDLVFVKRILTIGSDSKLLSDNRGTQVVVQTNVERLQLLLNFNKLLLDYAGYFKASSIKNNIEIFNKFYSKEIVDVCHDVLFSFTKNNSEAISEIYVENFLSALISIVYLLKEDMHLEEETMTGINHKEQTIYTDSAKELLHNCSLRLNFIYTSNDIAYLSQMLINYRFESSQDNVDVSEIVNKLVNKVSNVLKLDFSSDQDLIQKLTTHIPAMINRLKLHIHIRNPFTNQVKLEFSIMFNTLSLIIEEFENEIEFNDDELAFLTIYFQLSVERMGLGRKILIVCPANMGTSELLINRVKNCVSSLDSIEVVYFEEINMQKDFDISPYQIVLTTEDLELDDENSTVYLVNPLINKENLIQILDSHNTIFHSQNEDQANVVSFCDYMSDDLVFFYRNTMPKIDLLNSVGEKITKLGYVDLKFVNSVQSREERGGTALPIGVALPHGNPKYVNKTFISLVKCRKKIKWGEYHVDTIFIIGIAKEDMKIIRPIISSIYQLIDDKTKLKSLRHAKNLKEVKKVIYE